MPQARQTIQQVLTIILFAYKEWESVIFKKGIQKFYYLVEKGKKLTVRNYYNLIGIEIILMIVFIEFQINPHPPPSVKLFINVKHNDYIKILCIQRMKFNEDISYRND